jgi:transcriptional regulator with XRE-family HTH domain
VDGNGLDNSSPLPTKSQQTRFYRKLPAYLRRVREEAGLSQRSLGEKLGKHQAWVFKCESSIRRVDITEFMEWVIACEVEPEAAFRELLKMRHR